MSQSQTLHYKYQHTTIPTKIDLPCDKNASHGDHWAILSADIAQEVPIWLKHMLNTAKLSVGLAPNTTTNRHLLVSGDEPCHIKQVFTMEKGKPTDIINAFPCVESPYATSCQVERIIRCERTSDAILRLNTKDGSTIYAFDQLYSINHNQYQSNQDYQAHLSAWAYHIEPSDKSEHILIEDPVAIRYHRAFNDIVSANDGQVPNDITDQIRTWQPDDDTQLAPVEINLGHSCIYLYGETFGQEDEAWCQGQVLGISHTSFFDKAITLFDVVILREPDSMPLVVRIATPTTDDNQHIQVHDYIQANIWLQVDIYSK